MRGTKRKIFALSLALFITFLCALPAFAEATPSDAPRRIVEKETGSINRLKVSLLAATPSNAAAPGELIEYIDENGDVQSHMCIIINSADSYSFESDTWYAVKGDVTVASRISNSAPDSSPAHLILTDGSRLTVKGGINTDKEKGLNIYAQSEGTGRLTIAEVSQGSAGIGGSRGEGCGSIVIAGGVISIDGTVNGSGIGSGYSSSSLTVGRTGKVIIYRGKLTIHTKSFGNAIGSGNAGSTLEEITINGGDLELYGGYLGAGIGGGSRESATIITVNGGRLVAYGGTGAPAIGRIDTRDDQDILIVSDALNLYALDETGAPVKMTADEYMQKGTGYAAIGTEEATYSVRHLLQKIDLSGYEEAPGSPETYYGLVGTMTVAEKKHFDGFRSKGVTEQLIPAGSGLNLEVKHDRQINTLDFDLNGRGSGGPGPITAVFGAGVEEPSVKPTAEGYIFEGWYQEAECVNKYEFTTMPAENTTVYAKWTLARYTVTWKDKDRILRQDRLYFGDWPEYGDDPVRTGYRLIGWDPELQRVSGDAEYTAILAKPEEGWHIVCFYSLGGSVTAPVEVYEGETTEKPEDPVREHYIFGGWYTDEICQTEYDFSTPVTADLSLFAKWIPLEVQITWKDGDTTLRTDAVSYGTLPVYGEAPSKAGFAFTGWDPTVTIAESDTTYSATWKRTIEGYHVVGFDTQGGSAVSPAAVADGDTAAQPEDPVRAGYTFEGWYLNSEGSGDAYDFGTPVTADMLLYAKWTENEKPKYTITWIMGDKSDTTQVAEGEMPTHADPSREGYFFIGWDPAIVPAKQDAAYTAKFEQKTPEKAAVSFNTAGGSYIDTQVIPKNGKAVRPAETPVKTGYTFADWYRDASCTALFDFNTAVTEDITLYAKWNRTVGKVYTITFTDWDGKLLATVRAEEGSLPVYPKANPTRSGYVFTYWDNTITLATCDKTYKATYAKQTVSGGGGGGAGVGIKKTPTFSPNWYSDEYGVWRIRNSAGQTVVNAWLCDDVITANGKNVWYLLTQDGAMIANGLVQDNTGNFYSLETEHNGYFGMLRYTDGYYNCNGQSVYLTFNREHNGSFGAVTNADGLEKLKAIYGVTQYGIGNENSVYTAAL